MRLPSEAAWPDVLAALDERGHAVLPGVLDAGECRGLAALYDDREAFRSRVVMARHNYGRGEYKYLRYPLPPAVAEMRAGALSATRAARQSLARAARAARRASRQAFPNTSTQCHAAGQQRPTPLILKYGTGDYNCLHQDLYGEFVFPLQATVLLSARRATTSAAANSCSSRGARACSRAAKSCRSTRATP